MKRNLLLGIFSTCLLAFASCTADEEFGSADKPSANDSVDVTFNLTGIDVEEQPLGRTVPDPKTVYHIIVRDAMDDEACEIIGHIGVFTHIEDARLRLKRGVEYIVRAAALIESEDQIDVQGLSTITERGKGPQNKTIEILNKFSDYLVSDRFMQHYYSGQLTSPLMTDQSIKRYYNEKSVTINSNEQISLELKNRTYKLTCEIGAPVEGYAVVSCESPKFSYRVGTNDSMLKKSSYYSFDKDYVAPTSKEIILKLERFSSDGNSLSTSTKNITVKPNVNTIVKIDFSNIDGSNSFNLTLDNAPMLDEEVVWH